MSGQVATETLAQMQIYYQARAAEYDEWFYRKGRYDRGHEANQRWFSEAAEVSAALDALAVSGDVLELAPGTGIWTERLTQNSKVTSITAVDASPEMVAINRAKLGNNERVSYLLADLFNWQPPRQYDAVCFGFWLSHVPTERLEGFLRLVCQALRPAGKLFFIDSSREPSSTAADHILPEEGSQVMLRRLNDGREFQIVKNFYEPVTLTAQFAEAGLAVTIRETSNYFIYGTGKRN